jgi:hypothetical protein
MNPNEGVSTMTDVRPYRTSEHLWSVAQSGAGKIAVWPLRADSIHFDAARSSHLPANLPDGQHGSTVLTLGAMQFRASGNVERQGGAWRVTNLSANQYPSGRELTSKQSERASALIAQIITDWASTHEGDIAQADDIARNNAAAALEEQIARHTEALRILRRELRACENGRDFARYPKLPTGGR